MTTALLTQADIRARDAVQHQLEWASSLDASAVGIAAVNGAVTLTGYVDSYRAKLAAGRAAKRVYGVRAVANDIEVRLTLPRTDADVAADVGRALELRSTVPETIQAAVHHGHVTLTGTAHWLFQKHDAEQAVHYIRGVRGIQNFVTVAPQSVRTRVDNPIDVEPRERIDEQC